MTTTWVTFVRGLVRLRSFDVPLSQDEHQHDDRLDVDIEARFLGGVSSVEFRPIRQDTSRLPSSARSAVSYAARL